MRLGGPNSSGSCYICNGTGKNPPAPKPARTTTNTTNTTNTTSSLAAELQKLALLHTVGALTAEEFRKAKAKLLDSE